MQFLFRSAHSFPLKSTSPYDETSILRRCNSTILLLKRCLWIFSPISCTCYAITFALLILSFARLGFRYFEALCTNKQIFQPFHPPIFSFLVLIIWFSFSFFRSHHLSLFYISAYFFLSRKSSNLIMASSPPPEIMTSNSVVGVYWEPKFSFFK